MGTDNLPIILFYQYNYIIYNEKNIMQIEY